MNRSFRLAFALLLLSISALGQTKIEQAKTLFEQSKYDQVKKMLAPIGEKDGDYAASQYYLGRVAFEEKKYDDAQDFFEEAVDANDKVADYHSWLGNTYGTIAENSNMLKQGMLAPKMKRAWENAIARDSKNIGARTSLIQYYTKAPGFMGGSIEKAKEVANQLVKLKPAEGHRQLGDILLSEKKTAEAEKEYLLMAKEEEWYVSVLANFYVGQKQYDKAFSLFEEALKKNPEDYTSIYQVGKTSALSGQKLDRGEECLKKYLTHTPQQNEPSHAGANMRLAQIKEKRGNKAEAKKLFETALKMDGNLKEAKEGLERVSK
ncbi:MAG: tetratricopeptide repeat protein [Cyclobacteriaceae bacterium]